jgi:mono/diheme cytochrome c family protein
LIKAAVIVGIALLTFALGWYGLGVQSQRADPTDQSQVALGKSVYAQYCASCHGEKLEGQSNWRVRKPDGLLPTPPHDETGHTWHHPDKQLFDLTKSGVKPPLAPPGYRSEMPAFGSILSDKEIWAVLAFIKSTWPAQVRLRQSSIEGGQ